MPLMVTAGELIAKQQAAWNQTASKFFMHWPFPNPLGNSVLTNKSKNKLDVVEHYFLGQRMKRRSAALSLVKAERYQYDQGMVLKRFFK